MEKMLENPLEIIALVLCICFFILGIIFIILSKKKLCAYCEAKKTRHRNEDGKLCCEACNNRLRYVDAIHEKPDLLCPIHGSLMDKRIILETKNLVIHECSNPTCHIIILDKRQLRQISLLELNFYPEKK